MILTIRCWKVSQFKLHQKKKNTKLDLILLLWICCGSPAAGCGIPVAAGVQTKVAGPQLCGDGLVPGEPGEWWEQAAGGRHSDRHIIQNTIGYLLVGLWRGRKKRRRGLERERLGMQKLMIGKVHPPIASVP